MHQLQSRARRFMRRKRIAKKKSRRAILLFFTCGRRFSLRDFFSRRTQLWRCNIGYCEAKVQSIAKKAPSKTHKDSSPSTIIQDRNHLVLQLTDRRETVIPHFPSNLGVIRQDLEMLIKNRTRVIKKRSSRILLANLNLSFVQQNNSRGPRSISRSTFCAYIYDLGR